MDGMIETVLAHLAQYRGHADYRKALQRLRLLLDEEQARLFREQPQHGYAGQPGEGKQ